MARTTKRMVTVSEPLGSKVERYLRVHKPESLDESGVVTRQEVLWAATNGPSEQVDVMTAPSRLAVSLWRFAHDEPAKLHQTYASKLVEKTSAESASEDRMAADVRMEAEASGKIIRS